MRAKLMFILVTIGLVSCGLLVVRQQRLQTVYDMTKALQRSVQVERTLWTLRSQIGRETRPEAVRALADSLGPLRPIPTDPRTGDQAPPEGRPLAGATPSPNAPSDQAS